MGTLLARLVVVEEAAPNWEGERHALLSQRISDIGLEIRGTLLEKLVHQLYEDLAAKGLDFRPPVYLSDQWGCPDGTPLIGVPFYLADARLSKIEVPSSRSVSRVKRLSSASRTRSILASRWIATSMR